MGKKTGFRYPSVAEKRRAEEWLNLLEDAKIPYYMATPIAVELAYSGLEVPND